MLARVDQINWLVRLAWAACLMAASTSWADVAFPLTWRWSNPTPHGNNLIDVAYTNQFWIQVAERGQFYTSGDMINWTARDSQTTRALRAVTFFKDQIVITGESGTILSGQSAAELTLVDLETADWLEGVAASGDLAVAVGDNAAIYTTTDGVHWQRQNVPFSNWLRSVTFGPGTPSGLFVTVGEGGFVATSSDGSHWQAQRPLTANDLDRVAWFNDEFWALGDGGAAFQSSNGKNWSSVKTGATNVLNAFSAINAMRLAAGDTEVRLRANRTTWTDQLAASSPITLPPATYLSAATDGISFLLCGRTGLMIQGNTTNTTVSWAPTSDSLRNWLWDIRRFPNTYLAVGDRATIQSSLDGINWSVELPPDSATNSIFLGIGGQTNLAVVVGNAGTVIWSADTPQSVVSTNSDGTLVTNVVGTLGIFWQAVDPRPTTVDLQGVGVWGDRYVVSGAGGTILSSRDLKTWSRQSTPTTAFLSSIDSSPNGLVAVGKMGALLTSPDAVNWTARPLQTTNWIYRVRYLNNTWIAVGQNGTILTSSDGAAWIGRSSGKTAWLNDVEWIGGTYFVVGDQGTVLSSPDLVSWTDRGTITGKSLFGAAENNGMLVVVGIEGVIVRSQAVPFASSISFLQYPQRPSDSVFLFSGQPGQRFSLDRSTDLRSWALGPILELDPSGTLLHVDDGTNATNWQFFRALQPP